MEVSLGSRRKNLGGGGAMMVVLVALGLAWMPHNQVDVGSIPIILRMECRSKLGGLTRYATPMFGETQDCFLSWVFDTFNRTSFKLPLRSFCIFVLLKIVNKMLISCHRLIY